MVAAAGFPGCALYHDLKNPESIEATSLSCKSVGCLKIARRRIEDSTVNWRSLNKRSRSLVLESASYPPEGTASGSFHHYVGGRLVASESWEGDRQHRKAVAPLSEDPFEALTKKCEKLSATPEPEPHRYYCFHFSPDGLLSACGQYGYWPRWEDASCIDEEFEVKEVRN